MRTQISISNIPESLKVYEHAQIATFLSRHYFNNEHLKISLEDTYVFGISIDDPKHSIHILTFKTQTSIITMRASVIKDTDNIISAHMYHT